MKTKNPKASRARVSKLPPKPCSLFARAMDEMANLNNKDHHPAAIQEEEEEEDHLLQLTPEDSSSSSSMVPDQICSGNDCKLSIHDCLGLHCFDDNGEFYCPLCFYKNSVAKVDQLNRDLLIAKRRLQLAKTSLSLFLNGTHPHNLGIQQVQLPNTGNNTSSLVADEPPRRQSDTNGDANGHSSHLEQVISHSKTMEHENQTETKVGPSVIPSNHDSHQDFGFQSHSMDSPPPRHNTYHATDISQKEPQKTSGVNSRFEDSNSHCIEVVNANQFEEFQYHKTAVQRNMACKHTSSLNRNVGSSNSVAHYKPAKHSTNTARHVSKRKSVRWTSEEEEMLVEGLKVFSVEGKKPWRKILEYGCRVFNTSRTPIDLKDKWRNMMKEASRAKQR